MCVKGQSPWLLRKLVKTRSQPDSISKGRQRWYEECTKDSEAGNWDVWPAVSSSNSRRSAHHGGTKLSPGKGGEFSTSPASFIGCATDTIHVFSACRTWSLSCLFGLAAFPMQILHQPLVR